MLQVKFEGGIFTPTLLEKIREVINKRISLKVYEHLLENKFDVFGLIDAGLAETVTEDFNTYK